MYEAGGRTQVGCCVIERVAYDGLIADSAAWHSSGVYGLLALDAPVGTPLMIILDHLTLARGGGMGDDEVSLNLLERNAPMCGAANWSDGGVAAGPPVTTRLPTAVHLTAASWTCGGEIPRSSSFSSWHMTSGLGRLSASNFKVARSTTRLGLGGLDPVIAE